MATAVQRAPAGATHPTARLPTVVCRALSDARLVQLVRGGNLSAFEAIHDRHHGAILSFSRHMLGSREDAEDAAQHVFISAYREIATSTKPIELRPWLFKVARNRCISLLRARRELADTDVALEYSIGASDGLAEVVQQQETLRELVADIADLPDDQRAALVLFELGDASQRELATILGCRPEHAKALVYQARVALMEQRCAREAACAQIQMELSTARGPALLKSHLRRHLHVCERCREFSEGLREQRAALALVLPVIPTAGYKAGVLAAVAGSAAGPLGGGGIGGGLLAGVANGLVAKAAIGASLLGALGGAGLIIAHQDGADRSSADAGITSPALATFSDLPSGIPVGEGAREHAFIVVATPAQRARHLSGAATSTLRPAAVKRGRGIHSAARPHRVRHRPAARLPVVAHFGPEQTTSTVTPAVQTITTAAGATTQAVTAPSGSPRHRGHQGHHGRPPSKPAPPPASSTPPAPPGQGGQPPPGQRVDGTPGHGGSPPGHGGVPPGQVGKG